MSRTRKGTKGCGYEYWSRRPFAGYSPGRDTKTLTHRIERRHAKRTVQAISETGDPPRCTR